MSIAIAIDGPAGAGKINHRASCREGTRLYLCGYRRFVPRDRSCGFSDAAYRGG